MGTVFCQNCGYVIARNTDDIEGAVRDSGHSACPDCGSTQGIGWSPSELSQADIRGALNTPHRVDLRDGESAAGAVHRMMRDEARESVRSRKRAGGWLVGIGIAMLVFGGVGGGVMYYLTQDWIQAVVMGVACGFVGAWLIDRFLPQP